MAATKDETGNRYGLLTVLRRYYSSTDHGVFWLCKCDCGTEIAVRSTMLRSGNTRSCGCYHDMSWQDRKKTGLVPKPHKKGGKHEKTVREIP